MLGRGSSSLVLLYSAIDRGEPSIGSDLWGLYPDSSTYSLDNPSSLEFDDDGPERGCNQAKPSAAPYR
jgi:hypothetical protein